MSLTILERAKNPFFLRFNNTEFKVIDYQGRPWLLPEQIGEALELTNPRMATLKLYYRHQDEFGADETAEIEIDVERGGSSGPNLAPLGYGSRSESDDCRTQIGYGSQSKFKAHTQRQKVRIFSMRGAYHLGFFARTEIAKRFRQWVLDLIEMKGEERSLYADHKTMIEYLFEKRPRWRNVYNRLRAGDPTVKIAERCNCAISTVQRSIREMRKSHVINEREYTQWLESQRMIGRFLRDRAKRQLALGF